MKREAEWRTAFRHRVADPPVFEALLILELVWRSRIANLRARDFR
jgi:hypothetical protein